MHEAFSIGDIRDDGLATIYTFKSVLSGFCVDVAVPHPLWKRPAEVLAVELANAGIRVQRQSYVQRRVAKQPGA